MDLSAYYWFVGQDNYFLSNGAAYWRLTILSLISLNFDINQKESKRGIRLYEPWELEIPSTMIIPSLYYFNFV